MFSCSLQETLGIGCYEGVLAGGSAGGAGSSQLSRDVPGEFRYPRSGQPAGRHTSGTSRSWWRTSRRCWIAWSAVGTADGMRAGNFRTSSPERNCTIECSSREICFSIDSIRPSRGA